MGGEERERKGNGGGREGRRRREEECPGFVFEIYGHLRGRAWEVFPVESWRDVLVEMRLR